MSVTVSLLPPLKTQGPPEKPLLLGVGEETSSEDEKLGCGKETQHIVLKKTDSGLWWRFYPGGALD